MTSHSPQTLSIAGHDLTIKRHPRRRRLALRVRAGQVELLAPKHLGVQTLTTFATHHQAWWLNALMTHPVGQPIIKLQADAGAVWPLLGQDVRLSFEPGVRQTAFCDQSAQLHCVLRQSNNAQARYKQVKAWWKDTAHHHLAERTRFFAQQWGQAPSDIQIKSYRARWGSCDAQRRIQYNWKLICLPAWVVDYVVVHELCHLKQMNHSAAFWREVNQLYPDTPQAKAWLKQHGHHYITQLD